MNLYIAFRDILSWFFIVTIFNFLIVYPIIFHAVVIPKIQRRLGQKIVYTSPFYKMQVFAKWFYPPFDLGGAIAGQYLSWKIKNNISRTCYRVKNPSNPFVLARNGYDVREAPTFEILISFLVDIHMWLTLLVALSFLFVHLAKNMLT